MRKVEIQMNGAIRSRRAWAGGNTSVTPQPDGTMHVSLHGNLIAKLDRNGDPVAFTLAGWNTPTTRSRLNAVLGPRYRIACKSFKPQLHDNRGSVRPVDSDAWVSLV